MNSSSRSQILWSYTSTISSGLLQVVAAATITRFVSPAEYGLVALAMLCCRFPNQLSQLGMGRAVVQKPDLSEGNIRAAFTVSMGLGLAGCLFIAALSPLFAAFFHEPRLTAVLLVFSLNFIFQGALLVSGGLLRRELKMRQLAIADITSYLVSTFAIGLPIAVKGFGAWAIVASTVSQTLIAACLYYAATRHSLRLTLYRPYYQHIVSFGGKATFTSIIEALGSSMDTLVLGKFSTAFNVGLYNRGFLLIQAPVMNVTTGLTQVMFSRFSVASARKAAEAFDLLVRAQRMFLAIVFPLCAGAAAAASCIVLSIYGNKWSTAIPVYAVLCSTAAATASFILPAIQMEAQGRFRHKFIIQFLFMIFIGIAVLLAIPYGLVAVGGTLTVLELIRSFALNYYAAQYLNRNFLAVMTPWVPGIVAATPVGLGILFVARTLRGHGGVPPVVQLIACMLTGLGLCIAIYGTLYRDSIFNPLLRLVGLRKQLQADLTPQP